MTTYAITHPQQGTITYRDRKRWLWLASMVYPLVSVSGIPLYLWSGNEWALLVPVLSGYFGVTAMDWLFGADQSNPPEALVPQLEDDPYYRWLVILTIPMHFIVLLVLATFAAKSGVSPLGMLFLAITAGLYSGLGINTAHELGHKKSVLERWLSRIVLAVPAYGHFCVEHNRGHHRYVATPEEARAMAEAGADFLAVSFVRVAHDLRVVREAILPTTKSCSPMHSRRYCR